MITRLVADSYVSFVLAWASQDRAAGEHSVIAKREIMLIPRNAWNGTPLVYTAVKLAADKHISAAYITRNCPIYPVSRESYMKYMRSVTAEIIRVYAAICGHG